MTDSRTAPASAARLTAIACGAMFVFGIVMALIGAIVPRLTERLAFTLSQVGTLFLVMNFAMLAASLVIGLVVDRAGLRLPLVVGAWLVALGVGLIAAAGTYSALLPAAAALGFGGGLLNGAANTLVADLHDDAARRAAALNYLGVFFGFGALALPFALGALTSTLGLGGLLVGSAALCVALGVATLLPSFPAPKQAQGWPLANVSTFVRRPLVVTLALLLFFQSGNEFVLGGYTATLLTRDLAMSADAASYALAGFWAAIMLGRVAAGQVLRDVPPHVLVSGCAVAAAAGALLTASAPGAAAAVAGSVLTGVALAAIFPTTLGIAAARFPAHTGAVFGILFTVALAGGMTMPWLAGHLADAAGLRWVFVLAAANFLAVATLSRAGAAVGRSV